MTEEKWDCPHCGQDLRLSPTTFAAALEAAKEEGRREEREACARVADEAEKAKWEALEKSKRRPLELKVKTAADIAREIRARGKEQDR